MLHSINRISHELNGILAEFSSLFNGGIGNIPTVVHLSLNENSKPLIEPPRRVPFSLPSALKKELENMETNGIIEAVNNKTLLFSKNKKNS